MWCCLTDIDFMLEFIFLSGTLLFLIFSYSSSLPVFLKNKIIYFEIQLFYSSYHPTRVLMYDDALLFTASKRESGLFCDLFCNVNHKPNMANWSIQITLVIDKPCWQITMCLVTHRHETTAIDVFHGSFQPFNQVNSLWNGLFVEIWRCCNSASFACHKWNDC